MILKAKPKVLETMRIRQGLGIRSLSKKAGIAHTTLIYIERGTHNPRPSIAKKICEALNVDFDTLFEIKEGE